MSSASLTNNDAHTSTSHSYPSALLVTTEGTSALPGTTTRSTTTFHPQSSPGSPSSSSTSGPSSSKTLSSRNPTTETTSLDSIGSTDSPIPTRSHETNSTYISSTTSPLSSSFSATISGRTSSSNLASESSSRMPASSSGISLANSTTHAVSTTSSFSLTSVPLPYSSVYTAISSSTPVTTPSRPATISSAGSPTSTSVQSTSTAASDGYDRILDPSESKVFHNVIVDTGECSSLGVPKLIGYRGDVPEFTSLGGSQFSVSLYTWDFGGYGGRIFLADDGERCGSLGEECVGLSLSFGDTSNEFLLDVSNEGERSFKMYPFSFWAEGGHRFDGQPTDGPGNMYNCWGWSEDECPSAHSHSHVPAYSVISTVPNATISITFCPSNGPAISEVPPNPNPSNSSNMDTVATYFLEPTDTFFATSTFLVPFSPTRSKPTTLPPTRTGNFAMGAPTPSDPPRAHGCSDTATCIYMNTFLPIDETTIVPISSTVLKPYPQTALYSTFFNIKTTAVVPITTISATPVITPTVPKVGDSSPILTSWIMLHTNSIGSAVTSAWQVSTIRPSETSPDGTAQAMVPATATDSRGAQVSVIPTVSALTDSRGSTVSTISYNLTTTLPFVPSPSATPPPATYYTISSWTTYMTVNGSTIPAIGGQVEVLTTAHITYVLEPHTTITVGVLSSLSAESTRTSLPSSTAAVSAGQAEQERSSKIAGAVVGSLVGLTFLSVLVWMVLNKRKLMKAPDYVAYRSTVWGSGSGSRLGSGSSEGSVLDLDSEARTVARESFVEPWVEPQIPQASLGSRKMQREMEEQGRDFLTAGSSHGGGLVGASSSSDGRNNQPGAVRAGKSIVRVPAELNPEPLAQWPIREEAMTSIHSRPSPTSPAQPLPAPTSQPPAVQSPSSPAQPSLSSVPMRHPYNGPPTETEPRHNAIPPLYNEAWNIQRAPSSE